MFDINTPDPLGPAANNMSVLAIGNHIAHLVKKKYSELCEQHKITQGREISGFVMTTGPALEDAVVVSCSAGKFCRFWLSELSLIVICVLYTKQMTASTVGMPYSKNASHSNVF